MLFSAIDGNGLIIQWLLRQTNFTYLQWKTGITLPIAFTSRATYTVIPRYENVQQSSTGTAAGVIVQMPNVENMTAQTFRAYTSGGDYSFIAIGY